MITKHLTFDHQENKEVLKSKDQRKQFLCESIREMCKIHDHS